MAPNIQRPDPPYMQVVAHIRDEITSGTLREGDRLPSARQLSRDWSISLATATKALAALRSEGLARGVQGVGTIVVGPGYTPKDWITFVRRTGQIYTAGEHAVITSAALVPAPDSAADGLGIDAGAPAIRRVRVTYRGDTPLSASTSWYDGALAEAAPKLLQTERIRQGTPGYIEEQTGRVVTTGRDTIGARLATADDAAALQLAEGTAVLHGQNWYYDATGDVLEYGEYVSAGDRLRSYDYMIDR